MKRLIAATVAICLLFSTSVHAMTVRNRLGGKFSTNRVITIVGVIDEAMTASVSAQLRNTQNIGGPIVVDIQSPGGSIGEGRRIIGMLEAARNADHTRLVCVVEHAAHSMAFAILTHCDVRLATSDATMVVHKAALGGDPGIRLSAKNLRELAKDLDQVDEPMIEENRAAMHLSRADYDRYADKERRWTAPELIALHYLDGIVTVSE